MYNNIPMKLNKQFRYFIHFSSSTPDATNEALD